MPYPGAGEFFTNPDGPGSIISPGRFGGNGDAPEGTLPPGAPSRGES
jgi:hypothetical protein